MRPDDRSGQRIGHYLVIEDSGKRTKKGQPVWLALSYATNGVREVTEQKLVRLGVKYGFGELRHA
jgi:hypothetical protein